MDSDNHSILRCHILMGPPASGKSTLAKHLSAKTGAQIISTDEIRKNLYGDDSRQGDWDEVEEIMHEKIINSISSNQAVIVDATFAKRPWRLEITQNLPIDKKVEWIGWRLKTSLENCLIWNRERERKVPEEVIKTLFSALSNSNFGPNLSEGFASILEIYPNNELQLIEDINRELNSINQKIGQRKKKETQKTFHGYSRLLDLERLLYLIKLITFFPGLEAKDKLTKSKLEEICNPTPEGSMEEKASMLLKEWRGKCYSDINKIEEDLKWLSSQGFIGIENSDKPISPPEPNEITSLNLGGWHFLAEEDAFIRVMTLIRYILQNPHSCEKGVKLHNHLIEKLNTVYFPSETSKIRKDIEKILTPYGFRNKNDNTRHGYGLGAAILSINRLDELFKISTEAAKRLNDTSAHSLNEEIKTRFKWAGIKSGKTTRIFANKSIVNPSLTRSDSLANSKHTERLEDAIRLNHLIEIEFFSSSAKFSNSKKEKFVEVWPIQLIFHNIGWYLAYELKEFSSSKGLIQTVRLDRISLRKIDFSRKRTENETSKSIDRLNKLIEVSGGIYFGDSLEDQNKIINSKDKELEKNLVTVRFRAKENIYKFLREGLQRYPSNQIRISESDPKENWKPPNKSESFFSLKRISGDEFPYPIEIDIPLWTLKRDIDFKRWILGFRDNIKIESPEILVTEVKDTFRNLNNLYNK